MANSTRRNLPEVSRPTSMVPWGTRRSPFREITRLQRNIDRLFDEIFSPMMGMGMGMGMTNLPEEEMLLPGLTTSVGCDCSETDTHYLVSFDLPGIPRNEIRVDVRDHQLVVSGQRREEIRSRSGRERESMMVQRIITLPSDSEVSRIETNYHDGVLEVVIPKAESAQGRSIEVREGKSSIFNRFLEQREQRETGRDVGRESQRDTQKETQREEKTAKTDKSEKVA